MLALWGVLLAGFAFAIARVTLPALERHAHRTGLVDHPGGRKRHEGALPLTGGISVFLAVAVPAVIGILVALAADVAGGILPPEITVHLPGVRSKAPELLAILAGAGAHLLLGHLDDRFGLSPWLRLGIEGLCAAGLCAAGVRATFFLPWEWAHWVLTILFVVFTTNAVNFIDNMNGLMPGTVLIAGLNLLALAAATGQLFMAAILACLAGGLLAFLPRNFPKARAIMGDAGSLSLGFLLSAITVAFTFSGLPEAMAWRFMTILLPACLLALPVADGLTVVLGRLLRGVHPFTAGRDHLSHRLVDQGFTETRAVLFLWSCALAAGVIPVFFLVPLMTVAAVWGPALLVGTGLLLRSGSRP